MIGEHLADRYEILSELGRGGMGVVYRARDPYLKRDVAVKVISLSRITADSEERFLREARVVAQMDHPSIVPIYDLGEHHDALFFVMPVVEGTTLQTLVRQHSLDLEDTLEIIAQVAEALDYSHARGVVHRDIKPENVMVSAGEPLRARVMDFGLALAGAASRLTKTGRLPGTLIYLAPEQILATEIDGRSDLYSLGTILYEAIAGEPPFSGSRYSLLYRIAHEPPPPLTDRGVDLTLSDIVMSCLAKRPEERPQRGLDLAEALRRCRADLAQGVSRHLLTERRRGDTERAYATPLVGRRQEVGELLRRLDEASLGECRLVIVGGDAGMGKTRLLQEVEGIARERGVRVLHGRFSGESAFPYQGFGELLQDCLRSRDTTTEIEPRSSAEVDLADLGADLVTLFPVLQELPAIRDAELDPPTLSAAAAADDPTRIFELLARAFIRMSAGRPLVLLLEHLHASESAVDALQYLLRRLAPVPIFFVGTYRTSEVGRRHPIARLRKAGKDDPRFAALVLEPLSESEQRDLIATLLASTKLSDALVAAVANASEGNPFFVQELVRWLLETGDIRCEPDGGWVLAIDAPIVRDGLPETIQQVIEARLEQLDDELVTILATASVLGRAFDFAALEALVGGDVDQAVEELVHEGLLEEEPGARDDRLTFASRLVRELLHGGLPRRRRRLLHRRHGEWLEERYAGRLNRVYAALVHHFSEGDVPDKTIEYARELARAALESFGWEAAIRALRTALEFAADGTAGGAVEAELRRLLATAERAEGHLDAALKEAARAVRVAERAGLVVETVLAVHLAAEIAWQGRKVEETRQWLAKGDALAKRPEVRDLPEARAALGGLLTLGATLANLGGEYARARTLLDEVAALGGAEEEPEAPLPRGGTLVAMLAHRPATLEPGPVPTPEAMEVMANVFETLLASDEQGHLAGVLCRRWKGSEGGRRFRFELAPDVRFSDGTPLAAADVKASFERAAESGRGALASAFAALLGVDEFLAGGTDGIAGIEVVDERTVECVLREPVPIFPALLTDLRTAVFRRAAEEALGSGPFRLLPAAPDETRIRLERNPCWRGDPPPLDGLELVVLRRSAEVVAALRSGELDLGGGLLPEDLEEVLRDPRFRSGLAEVVQKNVYYVIWNAHGPLARRPEVRRALTEVVDVQDVVWRTLGRFAQPATGLIPPGVLGHDPGRRRGVLGRAEARAALLEASDDGEPLLLRGVVHPLFGGRYSALCQALFETWSSLGVEVEVKTLDHEGFLARSRDPEGLDFSLGRWVGDYDDPDNFTWDMLHSRHGVLAPYLDSHDADTWIERARRETRPGSRQRLYRKFESHLARHWRVLPLFNDIQTRVKGPRVRGLKLRATAPFVNYAELAKEPAAPVVEVPRGRALQGTLHVPVAGNLAGLEPERALFVAGAEVVPNVFETLTRVEEGAHIVPSLASELRAEDGGRRYFFRLRQGVRFHDGRRLTVRDVRYSFERLLRSPHAGARGALLPIRGARALAAGQADELAGFSVVSARELTLELEEPLSFFPTLLTSPTTAIVPEGTVCFDGNWREGTAGTGPFRVVRLRPGERVELEANPHYWRRGFPRTDRLVFELGMDSERVVAELRAGNLALAGSLRPADLESLLRDPTFASGYRETPGFSTYYLVLNRHREPLADVAVRRALVHVLDVGEKVTSTLGRIAVVARGLIPPGLLGQDGRAQRTPPETGAVEELRGLELRCALHPAYRDTYRPFWDRLAEALERAGVELEVVPQPADVTAASKPGFDLAATRWLADYPDSDTFVSLLHSTEGLDGAFCGHPDVDRLIERGRSETDPVLRHAIYREIESIVRREVLVVPLFHEQVYRFARPGIRGLRLGLRAPEVAYEELGWSP